MEVDVAVLRKLVRLEKVTSAVWLLRAGYSFSLGQADLSSQTQWSSWSPTPCKGQAFTCWGAATVECTASEEEPAWKEGGRALWKLSTSVLSQTHPREGGCHHWVSCHHWMSLHMDMRAVGGASRTTGVRQMGLSWPGS